MEILKSWYVDFFSTVGLKLVIARKGPRMVEFCRAKKWNPEYSEEGYVSEHAIPFLDIPSIKSIAIADDAIYFGSTFERIYSCVLTTIALRGGDMPPSRVVGRPAILSVEAKRFVPIVECLGGYEPQIVEKNEIPYYINSLISEFQHLGKPYDVEFPLLYVHFSEVNIKEKMPDFLKRLKSILEIRLPLEKKASFDNPYSLKHLQGGTGIQEENWTLLLNILIPDNKYRVKPEFRKLRFFVKDDKLCIASFALHILTDDMLVEDSPLFRGTPLAPLWARVWNAAFWPLPGRRVYRPEYAKYVLHQSEDERTLEIRWNEQVKDYLYHRSCSLLIWANYLLSFAFLLDMKNEMDNAFEASCLKGVSCLLDRNDLSLLIGEKLAGEMVGELQKLYVEGTKIHFPVVRIDPLSKHEVLPERYSDNFLYHNRMEFVKCASVSEFLSCNYSNQHRFLELATRKDDVSSFDRLSFGESYTSMQQKAELYFGGSSVRYDLHRGMDERIDMGSIVPKYVRVEGYTETSWLRLFRAGENEDKYKDQLHRVVWIMLSELAKEYKSVVLPQELILACFNLIAANLVGEEVFSQLAGIEFRVVYDERAGFYRTVFLNETCDENQSRDLLEYVADYNFLTKESDGFWRLNHTEYTEYLEGGCILDGETIEKICKYVKVAHFIGWHAGIEGIREIYNWLIKQDYTRFVDELHLWKEEIFMEALKNESLESTLGVKHFMLLNGINVLRERFPSIDDLKKIKRDLDIHLKNNADADIKVLTQKLFEKIDKIIDGVINDSYFSSVNTRINVYHALAFLVIYKFVLKNPDFITNEIDVLIASISPIEGSYELSKWLEYMKNREFFVEQDNNVVKDNILTILDYW